jgi:uncharacterized membrane protein YagU involved in acid resistance
MQNFELGNFIWASFASGILGTLVMTLIMDKITKEGWANADMVRAIGSIFTRSLENSFPVGIVAHIIFGVIIAFVYVFVFQLFNVHTLLGGIGVGFGLGFFHGIVVSLLLVVAVAEHHPLKEFQDVGFSVAAAHFGAHIVYGLVVGVVAGTILF